MLSLGLSCGGGDPRPDIALDGSPRHPSDQGIVTDVSFEQITLDGERTYDVSEHLKSFSTSTLELEPMLGRDGQYVLVGVEDGTVVWMAGVAQVVPGPRPTVYYTGNLSSIDESGRLIFRDGTVLQMNEGYRPTISRGPVVVKIDALTHRVREVSLNR